MLWMVVGYTQANLFIELEPTVWRQYPDLRRFEWVLSWQIDSTGVDATSKVGVRRPVEHEVPFENIVLAGPSDVPVLACWVALHSLPLGHDSFDGGVFLSTGSLEMKLWGTRWGRHDGLWVNVDVLRRHTHAL